MLDKFREKDLDWIPNIVELRGYVLNKAIGIEGLLDAIILDSLVDNTDVSQFIHSNIISDMNFKKKREIVSAIFKEHGKSSDKNYKVTNENLEKIGKFRNSIAHWKWDYSYSDSIKLKKRLNQDLIIKEKQIQDYVDQCTQVNRLLNTFWVREMNAGDKNLKSIYINR